MRDVFHARLTPTHDVFPVGAPAGGNTAAQACGPAAIRTGLFAPAGAPTGACSIRSRDAASSGQAFSSRSSNASAGASVISTLSRRSAGPSPSLSSRIQCPASGQSHLHVITPSSSARNSSIVAASMRLDLMLALRVVLSRSRFITMWRTMARLLAA